MYVQKVDTSYFRPMNEEQREKRGEVKVEEDKKKLSKGSLCVANFQLFIKKNFKGGNSIHLNSRHQA